MIDDEVLGNLLRTALSPMVDVPKERDLWPSIVDRRRNPAVWRWLDLAVAAATTLALVFFPASLWLLLYHL